MSEAVGIGYLATREASKVCVRAGPDVVYLRLVRDHAQERQETTMFAEMTPGDALRLIRDLQECVTISLQTRDFI